MKQHDGHWCMERADLIRINQLVRGRVDFDAFSGWFDSLTAPEQACLICSLCGFTYQAGVQEWVYALALSAGGLSADDPVVQEARKVKQPVCLDLFWLEEHVIRLDERDRFTVFRMFVYLFAVAEGLQFRRETKEQCNHWWHRDLLDDRVVQDLLSDSEYYNTSMRDDDRIKNPANTSVDPTTPSRYVALLVDSSITLMLSHARLPRLWLTSIR